MLNVLQELLVIKNILTRFSPKIRNIMQGAWFHLLQQSGARARGPLEAPQSHSAMVPPTKDGPGSK